MEVIKLRVLKYKDLKGKALENAKQNIELEYGDISPREKSGFLFLENGAILKGSTSEEISVMGQLAELQDDEVNLSEYLDDHVLTRQQIINILDRVAQYKLSSSKLANMVQSSELWDELLDSEGIKESVASYHALIDDPMVVDGYHTFSVELRETLTAIWENLESIMLHKKLDELKKFINI